MGFESFWLPLLVGIALAEAKLKELVALGAAIEDLDPPPDAAKEGTGEP
jgi:type II secretory pathway component PulM